MALGRLQNESIAASERDRKHPHGHHRREVEGRDAGQDAERLAKRVAVDPRSDILSDFALKQLRRAGCKLNDLHPALYFSLRIGNDFAVLGR